MYCPPTDPVVDAFDDFYVNGNPSLATTAQLWNQCDVGSDADEFLNRYAQIQKQIATRNAKNAKDAKNAKGAKKTSSKNTRSKPERPSTSKTATRVVDSGSDNDDVPLAQPDIDELEEVSEDGATPVPVPSSDGVEVSGSLLPSITTLTPAHSTRSSTRKFVSEVLLPPASRVGTLRNKRTRTSSEVADDDPSAKRSKRGGIKAAQDLVKTEPHTTHKVFCFLVLAPYELTFYFLVGQEGSR